MIRDDCPTSIARRCRYTKFIIDTDGTLYCAFSPIVPAVNVINGLQVWAEFLFLSNNASRTGAVLAKRLRGLGFHIVDSNVISSADLVLEVLISFGKSTAVFVIGSEALKQTVGSAGHRLVSARQAETIIADVDKRLT